MLIKLTHSEFVTIYTYIRRHYGINLEEKKFLIESKLWIELARCKVDNYTDYWHAVRADSTGMLEQRMIDLLTTNYTYFCREEVHFDFMTEHIVPELAKWGCRRLNIWCAACATGQECYTLAMYLMDCQEKGMLRIPFHILGTDISEKALHTAEKGIYGNKDYARLFPHWQSLYCSPFKNGAFEIQSRVKDQITFQKHNLLEPLLTKSSFQAVFCRNVLIYFKEPEQEKLLETVYKKMLPGGFLFVSQTESLHGCSLPLNYIQPAVYEKPEDVKNE